MKDLLPIDPKQCQSLKPNPEFGPFRFGPDAAQSQRYLRCLHKPKWVAMHIGPITGAPAGMSLCHECKVVMEKQLPVGIVYQRLMREV